MTGLSAIAGAAGEADARTMHQEAAKARAETDAARASDPTQESSRTTAAGA